MRKSERDLCKWVNYRIGKGVTHPDAQISVMAVPQELQSGLHAELIQELEIPVDTPPLCYDDFNHCYGFGGFVRWAYFADPKGSQDRLGIDWNIVGRETSGVANSLYVAYRIVKTLSDQGLNPKLEIVLLSCRMTEYPFMEKLRSDLGLSTLSDWIKNCPQIFREDSQICPRCGLKTLQEKVNFCYRCGCNPKLIKKGGKKTS